MARFPPFKPTEQQRTQAKIMAGIGVPQKDIALILGIAENTLTTHLRKELDLGMAEANAKVAQTLYQQAIGGNLGAAIFWLKARAGWREKHEVIVSPGDSWFIAGTKEIESTEEWSRMAQLETSKPAGNAD